MIRGAFEDKFAYEELINLIDKFKIERIVETGTYLGWSTKVFCELGLKVESIEINEEFYNQAKENLNFQNLNLHFGESKKVLSEIIEENEQNLLIFLDSHWYELPLLEELNVIVLKKIKPVIIIHDFYVPDERGNPKFGFDSYDGKNLDFPLIKNYLEKIYDNDYDYHYTKEIYNVDSGLIYIYPKQKTHE